MIRTGSAIAVLVAVISSSFYVAAVRYRAAKALLDPPKLNYLVLSFCSLRDDLIGKEWTARIDEFFSAGAFRFVNAINPNPWTAIFHYTAKADFRVSPNRFGYDVVGFDTKGYTRIPGEEIGDALGALREEILKPRSRPFMAIAHLTYMHYPYLDTKGQWRDALNPGESETIDSYLREPGKFPAKLPLQMILTGDAALAAKNPKTAFAHRKSPEGDRLLGLITNPELLKDWQMSEGYDRDVQILRKIYSAQAARADLQLQGVLNLWGDRGLRSRTVVIVMGDHGEMLMEHGELSHATALYESALKFPLLARFPGQTGGIKKLEGQVQLDSVAGMLEQAMAGAVVEENFADFFKKQRQDVMVLRDCTNKWRGLRVNNDWKYLVRLADGQKFLYDLAKDPGENSDLAGRLPVKALEFEQEYWRNYERFAGLPTRHCSPAVLAE